MPKNVHLDPEYQKKYRSQPEHVSRQQKYKQDFKQRKIEFIKENLGDCCSQCGSKDRLELDHINPKLREHHKVMGHRGMGTSLKHLKSQLALNNIQWLCYDCHKERTRQQNEAAWNLFISLPLDKQEELMLQCKKSII